MSKDTLKAKIKNLIELEKQGKHKEIAEILKDNPYLEDKYYGLRYNGII